MIAAVTVALVFAACVLGYVVGCTRTAAAAEKAADDRASRAWDLGYAQGSFEATQKAVYARMAAMEGRS